MRGAGTLRAVEKPAVDVWIDDDEPPWYFTAARMAARQADWNVHIYSSPIRSEVRLPPGMPGRHLSQVPDVGPDPWNERDGDLAVAIRTEEREAAGNPPGVAYVIAYHPDPAHGRHPSMDRGVTIASEGEMLGMLVELLRELDPRGDAQTVLALRKRLETAVQAVYRLVDAIDERDVEIAGLRAELDQLRAARDGLEAELRKHAGPSRETASLWSRLTLAAALAVGNPGGQVASFASDMVQGADAVLDRVQGADDAPPAAPLAPPDLVQQCVEACTQVINITLSSES